MRGETGREEGRERKSLLKKSTREGKNWQRAACVCVWWSVVGLEEEKEDKQKGERNNQLLPNRSRVVVLASTRVFYFFP